MGRSNREIWLNGLFKEKVRVLRESVLSMMGGVGVGWGGGNFISHHL